MTTGGRRDIPVARLQRPWLLLYTAARSLLAAEMSVRWLPGVFDLLSVGTAGACALAFAATGDEAFDYDPKADPRAKPWTETAVTLPHYPQDRDLLPIPLAAGDTLKVYVDRTALARAADGSVRLSLVVESARGARNVFFEGVRCETREYKTYAIGTSERNVAAMKDPVWRPIPRAEHNGFRDYLFRHYLCDNTYRARAPNELVELIVRGPRGDE